jgi:AcrR family transcriptional regulator
VNSSRRYHSPARAERAAATRTRLARGAAELFLGQGYATTTVAAVGRHCGVSAQTVYNIFGTKAALLKAAYDITLAGDGDPVPLAQRPDVVALYADPDSISFLRGYAALGRELLERVGPFLTMIDVGAEAGDPDLIDAREVTDRERLAGTEMVARRVQELGALAAGLGVEEARDRIWTLNSAQVWRLLTQRRGWSGPAYEEWIGRAMCAAVLAVGPG